MAFRQALQLYLYPLQEIFRTLHSKGQLEEQEMEQLYSEALGKFLADRFVTGTCPKCGYEVPPMSTKELSTIMKSKSFPLVLPLPTDVY